MHSPMFLKGCTLPNKLRVHPIFEKNKKEVEKMKSGLVEGLENFMSMGIKAGITPPLRPIGGNVRKGILFLEDAKGKVIEGKKVLQKGQIKWVFNVKSTQI